MSANQPTNAPTASQAALFDSLRGDQSKEAKEWVEQVIRDHPDWSFHEIVHHMHDQFERKGPIDGILDRLQNSLTAEQHQKVQEAHASVVERDALRGNRIQQRNTMTDDTGDQEDDDENDEENDDPPTMAD